MPKKSLVGKTWREAKWTC